MPMRYLFVILVSVFLFSGITSASAKRRHRGEPRTEVGLMKEVLSCLSHKDTASYFYLFPPFDSLWSLVMHYGDRSPDAVAALGELKNHPKALIQFDPYYNRSIIAKFCKVLEKGEDSGIHWNGIVMQRYELRKEENTSRDLIGFDRICPERFRGYMFVRDLMGRLTFCITIKEIQKINGFFYGGQVLNILEASTIEEFQFKEKEEEKFYEWLSKHPDSDTLKKLARLKLGADTLDADSSGNKNLRITNSGDDEKQDVRKEVIDRKYYEGKFDDEIPVKLFIRYLRDVKSGKTFFYDGLYKFGDQVNYVKLNITKDAEGKWIMEDEPPVGSLELELNNKTYTGQWTNNENQTGYDVVLKQTDIEQRKLEQLDRMLDRGQFTSANQASIEKEEKNKDEKSPRVERLERKLKKQKERDKQKAAEQELEQKAEKERQKAIDKADELEKQKDTPKPKKKVEDD